MKTRRGLVVVAAAALLTLSGTATALAADRTDPGRDPATRDEGTRDPGTRDAGARQGRKCDRLENIVAKLDRAKEHLQKKIDRVEEKIASGDLTPEQQERARAFLARLQNRLEKLEALSERLGTKLEEKCSQDD